MKYSILLFIALFIASCGEYKRIGQFTMISTRNIDRSQNYELLQRDVEAVIKTDQDDVLQEGIDKAIKKTPGGEYMMNVKIYLMTDGSKLKVIGDIYGIKTTTIDNVVLNSFNVGDTVQFEKKGQIKEGIILSVDEGKSIVQVKYLTDSGRYFKEKMPFDKVKMK